MNIQIVTVYKSKNFGSYLQADCLYQELKKYGAVYFVDAGARNLNFFNFLRECKKNVFGKDQKLIATIVECCFNLVEYIKLLILWNKLPHKRNNCADITVLGSDEIWNIKRGNLISPIFFGENISSFKFSYAPSVNNSEYADFLKNKKFIELINNIDVISVRDKKSKEMLTEITENKVEVVLDPTLLNDPAKIAFKPKRPYIAVYIFQASINEQDVRKIKDFAQKNNLDIVSCGLYLNWCDYCVHSKLGNAFYIFEQAAYVVTNTFHGTAYAINYRKNFVSIVKKNDKILNLLSQFGLENRCVSSGDEIESVLMTPVNTKQINDVLLNQREKSLGFIRSCISRKQGAEEQI